MATGNDDWGIQISLKHGPNNQYMTNVRGYTATEIAEHLAHLGEHSNRIQEGINTFLAVETMRNQFPELEPVRESRYGSNDNRPAGGGEDLCAHNLPRKFMSGVKNGKAWKGMFCPLEKNQNPCAPKWLD